MTTAIIDYGSGNLHSAQKAFERAARETGVTDAIIVTNDPGVEASYTPFLKNLLGSDITVEALKDKYIDPLSVAASRPGSPVRSAGP